MTSRWIGAVEGYYGPPLSREARIELVRWMGSHGFNSYCYAPKDDPFHRQRWREPYPPAEREALAELVEEGRRAGVEVALAISPGLDYRAEDAGTLVTKLQSFRDLGARILAVAWDDVNPGGAELGELHGGAIAAAVDALDDGELRWVSCPTDYAASSATPYLRAFADALPDKVDILWTGPSIVTPDLSADMVRAFATELGRPPLFGENFPVNDGTMINVLHLGPYPPRDPEVVAATTGVWCNLMPRALASRPGLALATRFWNDPRGEREQAWAETIAEFPGLGPLARASRNWANDGEPDAELLRWAEAALDGDQRLMEYLRAGCRSGLDAALAAEIEPWVEQWDFEAQAMQMALELLARRPLRPAALAFMVAHLWMRARGGQPQLFGVRWAYYPVTVRGAEGEQASADALVVGENLTDRLCRLALTGEGSL